MSFQRGTALIADSPDHAAQVTRAWRKSGRPVVLVPTGSFLHVGHIPMLAAAQKLPLQPLVVLATRAPLHTLQTEELPHLLSYGVDLVLHYDDNLLNHNRSRTTKVVPINRGLEPASQRAESLTRMVRLFGLLQPTDVMLGERDYEKLIDVQQAITDLYLGIQVHATPVQRIENAVPMSVSYAGETPGDQQIRSLLAAAVLAGQAAGDKGAEAVIEAATGVLNAAGITPNYAEVRARDLGMLMSVDDPDARLIVGASLSTGVQVSDSATVPLGAPREARQPQVRRIKRS